MHPNPGRGAFAFLKGFDISISGLIFFILIMLRIGKRGDEIPINFGGGRPAGGGGEKKY